MRVGAVLFDRDGTLVVNVPYNGDPEQVVLMPGATEAIDLLRRHGIPTAVVSNQSGVGRGMITMDQVHAVNRRVEDLLGALGPWCICPHAPEATCPCRKPQPHLILQAATLLGVDPATCVVLGDGGQDMAAARAAGARGILIPTSETPPDAIAGAESVAPSLLDAVRGLVSNPG